MKGKSKIFLFGLFGDPCGPRYWQVSIGSRGHYRNRNSSWWFRIDQGLLIPICALYGSRPEFASETESSLE